MQTPTLQPKVDSDRIVLIGDPEEPRPRLLLAMAILALIGAMALGGGIVYAWQQGAIHDRDRLVHTARVDAQNARDASDGAFARADSLQSQITNLQALLEGERAHGTIQQGEITDAQARVASARARLDEVKDRLRGVIGPRVSNGRHIAFLLAAATEQSPPLMAIDLGRWYTGDAARRAAAADGALVAGEHLFHGRYLRNSGHDWRIVPVGTGALFTIRHYAGATVPTNVSFTTLATILNGGGSQRIANNPFWVEVQGHTIVSGHEQRYRAP